MNYCKMSVLLNMWNRSGLPPLDKVLSCTNSQRSDMERRDSISFRQIQLAQIQRRPCQQKGGLFDHDYRVLAWLWISHEIRRPTSTAMERLACFAFFKSQNGLGKKQILRNHSTHPRNLQLPLVKVNSEDQESLRRNFVLLNFHSVPVSNSSLHSCLVPPGLHPLYSLRL